MLDSAPTSDVFTSILRVLERIEDKLDGQDQRLDKFEDTVRAPRSARVGGPISEVHLADLPDLNEFASPATSIADFAVGHLNEKAGVPYSDVDLTFQEAGQNEQLKKLLESYLGDCWKLPDDKRLPLNLTNRAGHGAHAAQDPQFGLSGIRKEAFTKGLERLKGFDNDLRSQPGNDFFIIDYSPTNTSRLYRIGEKAVGSELRVSLGEPSHHQWSRLMYVMSCWLVADR